MSSAPTGEVNRVRSLRLWPGLGLGLLILALRFVVPRIWPGAAPFAVLGTAAAWLLIVLWWAFFSRAALVERWIGVLGMIVALAATRPLLHESIAGAGMGLLFPILAAPILGVVLVGWAMLNRDSSGRRSLVTLVLAILIASGCWTLLRTGGITNTGESDFFWRWTPTAEERLLAAAGDERLAGRAALAISESGAEWPGFRGPDRDGRARGSRIETDWSVSPPVELWRRAVGPGWSSFAVHGDLVFTQEQRGEEEVVSCYDATNGEPVWRHGDTTRFWESNAGAGPRATPTLHDGRVYAFGGTGILNVLDARSGSGVWSRDVGADTGVAIPTWGFSSSPLVVADVVIVAAVGQLVAYDLATGEPRWFGPDGGDGYSSPHLLTLDGVDQVLLMSKNGAVGVSPVDGTILWQYEWPGGSRIVQPALTVDGDLLMSRGSTTGIQRAAIGHGSAGWSVEERWTSNRLKPFFSDFVVHRGYAYGFDGNIMASIDIESGERAWKGGRYGSGQLVLLPDQDLLLVVTEKGDLALVAATPDGFTELARHPAIEGKTWNHPVLVGDRLFVRNGEEMVAFRLPLASG